MMEGPGGGQLHTPWQPATRKRREKTRDKNTLFQARLIMTHFQPDPTSQMYIHLLNSTKDKSTDDYSISVIQITSKHMRLGEILDLNHNKAMNSMSFLHTFLFVRSQLQAILTSGENVNLLLYLRRKLNRFNENPG